MNEVIRRWRSQGVQLNPGASESQIARLAALLEVALPDDVRAFFSAMNGMPDDETEDSMTCFWSIERILKEPHLNMSADAGGEFRDIAIADVCIDAWFVRLRARSSGVTVILEGAGLELPSLEAFFARYRAVSLACW